MKTVLYQYRDTPLCNYGYRRKVFSHGSRTVLAVDTHEVPNYLREAGRHATFVRLRFGSISLCEISPAEAREIAVRLIETAKACEDERGAGE